MIDVRGVFWLPADAFLRLDAARYEPLLARVRELGFNTLRVAGGGIPETDTFYDLCDRQGLLVLQEAPLTAEGQGMGPDEYLFSAAAAIRRLRSHPSLVAWCVGASPSAAVAPDPRLTAELAALCGELDPQRQLLGDSPLAGPAQLWTTRPDPKTGRTQWLGASLRHVPGVPSPSAFTTLFAGQAGEPEWPMADEWAVQASRSAAPYGVARSARELVQKAQAAQAAALQRAAERYRLAPAGEVFWQLNEPSPGTSPALLDAAGVPKPACYALRRALGAVAIFADFGGEAPSTLAARDALWGQAVVATDAPLRGARATASILDRSARCLDRWESRFDAPQGAVTPALAFRWAASDELAGDVAFLHLRLDDAAGKPLASNLYWFGVTAPRTGPRPRLRVAWLTSRPRGPLADPAFLAATGIEVARPERAPDLKLDGFHVVVVDPATVFTDFTDADLKVVADAVAKGCGLLVDGLDAALFDSSLGPLLPVERRLLGEQGTLAARPAAQVPDHPVLASVSFDLCPNLPYLAGVAVVRTSTILAGFDAGHPLLAEGRHGEGRVLVLTSRTGGELAAWADVGRFTAGLLGYLARLPHPELAALIEGAQPAPLRALDGLDKAAVQAKTRQDGAAVAVELTNTSKVIAFQLHLGIEDARGRSSGLISLSDNDFCLLPGESRTVRLEAALAPGTPAQPAALVISVGGWNLPVARIPGSIEVKAGRLDLRGP